MLSINTLSTLPVDLTIVLPTFNEEKNIRPILAKLDAALEDVNWEAVFVDDDSRDGTSAEIFASARTRGNVRIIRRIGRRGLSTAVIEGALSSTADYIAVMDADMQHDERVLPEMLAVLKSGRYDLVVGTRYVNGGGIGDWSATRAKISKFATRLSQSLSGIKLSDPMSGYFMITRPALETAVRQLSGQGFKILLDIVMSSPSSLRIAEQPFKFRSRQYGESKLDAMVAIEFVSLLLDKLIGRWIPVRLIFFMAVGGIGLLVHMAILSLLINVFNAPFPASQASSTGIAMVFNFFLNNILTYHDRRLKGFRQLAGGLISFVGACSIGAIANVGVASMVFHQHYSWWLSGVAGVAVGTVWNYAATSFLTWRKAS